MSTHPMSSLTTLQDVRVPEQEYFHQVNFLDELVIVTDMVLNDDEKESCYQEKYLGENTNKLNEICQAQLGKDPKKFFP